MVVLLVVLPSWSGLMSVCAQRWLVPLRPLQLAAAHQSACRIPLRGYHRLGRDQPLGQPGMTPASGGGVSAGHVTCSLSLSCRDWVEGSWAQEPPQAGGP